MSTRTRPRHGNEEDSTMTDGESEGRMSGFAAKLSELYDHVTKNIAPRLGDVEDEAETLRDRVEQQQEQITALEQQLESIADLGEKAQSTPEARARDLRILLSNQAKAKAGRDGRGLVQWTYSQVQEQLEANGHGTVYNHQAYTAMEDAAEADGFADTTNEDGERVIRASWQKITVDPGVIENNNAGGVSGAAQATKQPTKSKSD